MSDSNSSLTYSTLSLDSENSDVNPLDSIFKSCLNALSPEPKSDNGSPVMPGLFKILSLMDRNFQKVNRITNNPSISRLLSTLPEPVASSSTTYSEDIDHGHGEAPLVEKNLNPMKVGSSIFYDSSDKGDTFSSFHLKKNSEEGTEVPSSFPKLLVEPMSGDCVSINDKVLRPEAVVHQVYYSMAATNLEGCDSENNLFQESVEQIPPPEGGISSIHNSENEGEDEKSAADASAVTGADHRISVAQMPTVEASPNASKNESSSESKASGSNQTNNNASGSSGNSLDLPIIPDFLDEDELYSQEHMALCLRQLVGNNITLTPRSPSQTKKYSDDFSNLFY